MAINLHQLKTMAQDMLSKNSDKIEQGLDKASGMAKSRFGKQSSKIDNATEKAKKFLHKNAGGGDTGQPGGQPPPPRPQA